jgi:hypothetical protein
MERKEEKGEGGRRKGKKVRAEEGMEGIGEEKKDSEIERRKVRGGEGKKERER